MERKILDVNTAIEIAKKKHKEGNLIQANEIYKGLIDKKIYTFDLLVTYGLFNIEIKNFVLAKKLFFFSIKKYPSFKKSYILLAEILSLENNFHEALKVLLSAKNINNNNSDVEYNLSVLYKKNKLYAEALNSINNALLASPDIEIYQILKADILIDKFENEIQPNVEEPTNQAYDSAASEQPAGGDDEGEDTLDLEI